MESIKIFEYYCYILSITCIALSLNSVSFLAYIILYDRIGDLAYDILVPFPKIIGVLLGAYTMSMGRRKMIITADILLIPIIFLECFPLIPETCVFSIPIFQMASGYVTFSVMLYIKEIPAFLHSGIPLCLYFFLQSFGEVIAYLFNVLYPRPATRQVFDELKTPYNYIRIIPLSVLFIPALIQPFLFVFVYKQEPIGYSISVNSQDEAILAARELYQEGKAEKIVQDMTDTYYKSRYLPNSWKNLLTTSSLCHILLLFISLMFICIISTSTVQLINTCHTIEQPKFAIYKLYSAIYYAVWIGASFGYIDKLPNWQLQTIGFSISIILHLFAGYCFLYIGKESVMFYISCIMGSLPAFAFILVPFFKFILSALPDKGICLCLIGFYLGYIVVGLTDDTGIKEKVVFPILVSALVASIFGLVVSIAYIRRREIIVSAKKISL